MVSNNKLEIEIDENTVFLCPIPNAKYSLYNQENTWGIVESDLVFEDSDRWILEEGEYNFYLLEEKFELEELSLSKEQFETFKNQIKEIYSVMQRG
jgi:hypothetical protein